MTGVIASAAKQSSAQCRRPLDCFVARASRNDEFSRSRGALLRPSHSSRFKKAASNGREAVCLLPLNEGGGAPNGAPKSKVAASGKPSPDVAASLIRGPLAFRRSSAVMRQGFSIPNSARAALPGITGSKREDPLRHQCSEHLAVRSRAGRDDAQAACEQKVTNSARKNRTRSVSRRLPVDVPHDERDKPI